jgi:glycosyltransferase involved in cell wall biosynthesis
MGRLTQPEIDELLLRSRIFALISDYEGLSFSLLQAMSFGLPVVVSNTSGNASVISKSNNGKIVDPKSRHEVGPALS